MANLEHFNQLHWGYTGFRNDALTCIRFCQVGLSEGGTELSLPCCNLSKSDGEQSREVYKFLCAESRRCTCVNHLPFIYTFDFVHVWKSLAAMSEGDAVFVLFSGTERASAGKEMMKLPHTCKRFASYVYFELCAYQTAEHSTRSRMEKKNLCIFGVQRGPCISEGKEESYMQRKSFIGLI